VTVDPRLNERLASLSPEKRALLLQQIAQREKQANAIARRPRPARTPLSFAQQRLWLLDQLEPGTASYNLGITASVRGRVDAARLQQSLDAVVARHESLRTTFPSENGTPWQEIVPSLAIPLQRFDARDRAHALDLVRDVYATPFDLARGPLARFLLIRIGDDEHLLAVAFHHIVMDGWSIGVFYRELFALYGGDTLDEPALQYADFALWQREWLQGDVLDKQLGYWKDCLAGELPVLELPAYRPRPPVQSYRGEVARVSVPNDVRRALQELARRENATLFMVFLAALKTLLFRYSGQSDVIVGSGIANRHRQELEPLVGCFVNTLALRTDLAGNPTFRELLARVRDVTLDAYAHQDLPLERLLEELHVERSMSRSPLFQVMLFFQNHEGFATNVADLELRLLELDEINTGTARTDLTLFVGVEADRLDVVFEYATDLFDAETIRAFGAHLVELLRQVARDPEARVGDVVFLSDAERHELVVARNATRRDVPAVAVHRLIEAQAAKTPDAIAVVAGNAALTYRELDTRANALAAELHARGIGRGDLVGLRADRGVELLIGLVGILKSGAAYVPLDPSFPEERLAFMIEDAAVKLVVDAAMCRIARDAERIDVEVDPNDLAYVIFTSGSTGRPKGVEIPHGAVVNFLQSMARTPGLAATDVFCAVTTLSFDIAVLELLLPLTVGARVVIADRETAADGMRLARLIADSGTTVMQATPATWRMLVDSGWNGGAHLKLLCGGEALPRELAERLLDRCGELWNVYGPTETTVWSSLDRVTKNDAITIGRPIDNTTMYVVDARMQLVPDGVSGELLIGGAGVARGYLARPELTLEKFIADPFSDDANARVYRTGDIARCRRDGRLEVLGRGDHQVKLRGYRIELGEIENVLARHASVVECVVVAREDRPGDKRLVVYVAGDCDANALRAHLRASLPDYMVPSAFVALAALPRTPNGKIDRKALPAPEAADVAVDGAPRNADEATLVQIWAEVLGTPRLGIHDDFFAHGGHSLLATQLIARVSKSFGVEIPLRRLFDAPTVAQFAEAVVAEQLARVDAAGLDAMLLELEGLSDADIRGMLEAGSA